MHLTASPVDWYAARAAGVVAYVVLSTVVILGLTMSSRRPLRRWPRFALEDVHRFGGLLVGTFTLIHVGTIAIDSYLPFSLTQIVVPLTAHYRPFWIALGIVAAELLVALALTNRYRDRLPYRFWRRAHYLNFAVWAAATLHGLGAGTDRSAPWLMSLYAAAVGGTGAAIAWRATRARIGAKDVAWVALGTAACAALLVVVLAQGPLRFTSHRASSRTFETKLSARVVRQSGPTTAIVSLVGNAKGANPVLIRADLLVQPQGVDKTAFQMEFLRTGSICRGEVSQVAAFAFDATCTARDGITRTVHAQWETPDDDEPAGTTEGTLKVSV